MQNYNFFDNGYLWTALIGLHLFLSLILYWRRARIEVFSRLVVLSDRTNGSISLEDLEFSFNIVKIIITAVLINKLIDEGFSKMNETELQVSPAGQQFLKHLLERLCQK